MYNNLVHIGIDSLLVNSCLYADEKYLKGPVHHQQYECSVLMAVVKMVNGIKKNQLKCNPTIELQQLVDQEKFNCQLFFC